MVVKNAIVSVSNDLSSDRRVDNTCSVLVSLGYNVILVGRKIKGSSPLPNRSYKTFRMLLFFHKGFGFYAEFNLRLFFFLLFRKAKVLVSNDLDTLLPNYLIGRLFCKNLVYDSHEFFTGVPELVNRPRVRKFWERIEMWIFPKLTHIITVNKSISLLYKDLYNKNLIVVRNVPPLRANIEIPGRKELGLPENKPIILLQGAWINVDRGGEEAVKAMEFIDDALLLIIGSGDVIGKLKNLAENPGISGKVMFIDRLPFNELFKYTSNVDIGLTLDKDTNINYRFSLPNKLFDYIHAGIPVLASPLPEIINIIEYYKVGELISDHQPQNIAAAIRSMLNRPEKLKEYHQNCLIARNDLCWDKEKEIVQTLYRSFL